MVDDGLWQSQIGSIVFWTIFDKNSSKAIIYKQMTEHTVRRWRRTKGDGFIKQILWAEQRTNAGSLLWNPDQKKGRKPRRVLSGSLVGARSDVVFDWRLVVRISEHEQLVAGLRRHLAVGWLWCL